ncbi:hypothetical protein SAMN05421505_1208 [Sinosporangium album]|uniref:Homeodomain-like domain-containing protein n=1 Tax=Sinosporangium album TaxID=504805 RepID=A0A1G8EA70_9ACTN|nr:hypothetical protein [Sinosporangium album]SDH66796.1 hypothetical protein SAMN05421505_1208 [Sinosporangium album]
MSSYIEAIFDQADIPENLDQTEAEVEATVYRATATRTGKYWTATVHDLPDGQVVRAQGSTWKEARNNALECVLELLGPTSGTVGVHLSPADPKLDKALKAVGAARTARAYAEQAERDAVRTAAHHLIGNGWSTRDAGSALGLSHQRISQIINQSTD